MSISNPEIKKLYGLAAGRCSICKIGVFDNDVHIGEMAHIIAKSSKGARGNEELSSGRNSYDNLILLCANHHTEVDKNPSVYSVDRLRSIKLEHENAVASVFNFPKEKENDLSFLKCFMQFVPFTRLPYFVEYLPTSVNLDLSTVGDMFDALCKDNPHLYPLNDQYLQVYFDSFIRSYYDLWSTIAGYTDVEGRPQANFSQADERFYLHMEKKYLPYEKVEELINILEEKKSKFISEYMSLINFLRSNYKEVDLNSYRQ